MPSRPSLSLTLGIPLVIQHLSPQSYIFRFSNLGYVNVLKWIMAEHHVNGVKATKPHTFTN